MSFFVKRENNAIETNGEYLLDIAYVARRSLNC